MCIVEHPWLMLQWCAAAYACWHRNGGNGQQIASRVLRLPFSQGFLQMKLKPWVRRLITRGIAIVPAIVVSALLGDAAVGRLLLLSQVSGSMMQAMALLVCGFVGVGSVGLCSGDDGSIVGGCLHQAVA